MRILFLSSYYPPHTRGGAEISTHYLAQGLVARGHAVTVITQGESVSKEKFEGVEVMRLPLPFQAKPLLEERHAKKLAQQLLQHIPDIKGFDIIHAHDFRMTQVACCLNLPRFIATVRDYAAVCGTTNAVLADGTIAPVRSFGTALRSQRIQEAGGLRKLARMWQYLYNLEFREQAFRAAATHVYISHAQQELIGRYASFASTHKAVIYNPVGDMFLKSVPQQEIASQNILYVGTVETYKGVGLLLEAFEKLAQAFPQATLTIVGEGAQKKVYEAQTARANLQGRIHFKGKVSFAQLPALYDEAGIVVAPHIWIEPFGRTVAEAMARRKVVVAANAGGPSEMIEDGKNALLFERNSVQGLRDALKRALQLPENDRQAIQNAAHVWVEHSLSQSAVAQQYEAEYSRLLS